MGYASSLLIAAALSAPPADAPMVTGSGTIEAPFVLVRIDEKVDVPAREAGVLTRVSVQEGDHVKAGQVLARVSDVRARMRLEHAEIDARIASSKANDDIEVRVAQKSLVLATAELDRAKRARKRFAESVSQADVDRLKTAEDLARLEIEKARHQQEVEGLSAELKQSEIRLARQDVDRRTIASPLDGMVAELHVRQGEWVEPGTAVVKIVRLDQLRAEAFLDASVASFDLLGRKAHVRLVDAPEDAEPVEGRVVFVSPEVNESTNEVRVRVELPNPDLVLRPGLKVDMTILPAASPASAASETKPKPRPAAEAVSDAD